jgi:ankyrin
MTGGTALTYCGAHDVAMSHILVEGKANVNAKSRGGHSPLFWAVNCGNMDLVKYLLDHEADIEIETNDNIRPIHVAVQQKNLRMVKLLLRHKAQLDPLSLDEETPLDIARKRGFKEIEAYLREKAGKDSSE